VAITAAQARLAAADGRPGRTGYGTAFALRNRGKLSEEDERDVAQANLLD
jgi:hypothetical protein